MAGALILVVASVPVIIAVAMLMPWFLGHEWREAFRSSFYLAASMVLLIFQAPLVAACHYFLKPQLVTFGWVLAHGAYRCLRTDSRTADGSYRSSDRPTDRLRARVARA